MTKVFLILLAAAGAALLVVLLKFGTIDPCGILRAELRQEAARAGGFGVVASALFDGVINGMIAAQYGPLSPGRCIALAFLGAPPPQAPAAPPVEPRASAPVAPVQPQANQQGGLTAPQSAAEALKRAGSQAEAAIIECRIKRLSGELKTYATSAECSSPRIIAAYQKAGYRYMDLISLMQAKRRELAERIDKGNLTEAQGELEFAQFMTGIKDKERQRDREQR